MQTLVLLLGGGLLAATVSVTRPSDATHRYLIERTFEPGALDGLDAATKRTVNANNASVDVTWVHSYASADRTKTFCVYEGPSEAAVRQAAAKNGLPIDRITEVPVDLLSGTRPGPASTPLRRYLVERTFPVGALDGLDEAAREEINRRNASLGVRWVTSYANAERTRTFCVYEGPSERAVRDAAVLNAIPVDRVTEVPVDLEPR